MRVEPVRSRASGLAAKWVGDELVVHDLDRDRTHLLNPVTAAVWTRCETGASLADLAAHLVGSDLAEEPHAAQVVSLALAELSRAELLDTPVTPASGAGFSRRDLLKRGGVAALTVPTIITIMAPPAAASHSTSPCVTNGSTCGTGEHDPACCEPGTCTGGRCCLPLNGTGCLSNAGCCQGICSNPGPSGRCCVANGAAGTASTCCSGSVSGAGTCCVPTNSSGTTSTCCSGAVRGDGTCCLPIGQVGTTATCCSGAVKATGSTCCVPEGQVASSAAQCCSGRIHPTNGTCRA
jgi:hypothetical protein